MAPLNLETFLPGIVGQAFVSGFGVLIAKEEAAIVAVALAVVAGSRKSP